MDLNRNLDVVLFRRLSGDRSRSRPGPGPELPVSWSICDGSKEASGVDNSDADAARSAYCDLLCWSSKCARSGLIEERMWRRLGDGGAVVIVALFIVCVVGGFVCE